jgi:hypothetical protein
MRLARRSQGADAVLEPRFRARFEGTDGGAPALERQVKTPTTPARGLWNQEPNRPGVQVPAHESAPEPTPVLDRHRAVDAALGEVRPLREPPLSHEAPALAPVRGDGPGPRDERGAASPFTAPRTTRASKEPPAPVESTETHDRRPPPRAVPDDAARVSAPSVPRPVLDTLPAIPLRPHPRSSRLEEAPRPLVRVSIGRVEVRAAVATPPPSRRVGPADSRLPLEEYLRQRREGRR